VRRIGTGNEKTIPYFIMNNQSKIKSESKPSESLLTKPSIANPIRGPINVVNSQINIACPKARSHNFHFGVPSVTVLLRFTSQSYQKKHLSQISLNAQIVFCADLRNLREKIHLILSNFFLKILSEMKTANSISIR